jgi:hypothetical protein
LIFCFCFTLASKFSKYNKTGGTQSLSREWEKKRKIRARSQNSNAAAAWHVFDLFIYLFIIFFSCLLFDGVVRGTQSRNNRAEHCSRNSDKANCFFIFVLVYSEKVLLLFPLIRLLVLLLLARL